MRVGTRVVERRNIPGGTRDFSYEARRSRRDHAFELAPFSALGEGKGCRGLLGPGWRDLEELEDAALCVGEAVELDTCSGVGKAESLEDGEHVASGWFR